MTRRSLGRGLDALIDNSFETERDSAGGGLLLVAPDRITPSPFQPSVFRLRLEKNTRSFRITRFLQLGLHTLDEVAGAQVLIGNANEWAFPCREERFFSSSWRFLSARISSRTYSLGVL